MKVKKLLSVALVLVMLLSISNFSAFAVSDVEISTLDEFKTFRDAVNAGDTYAGKTVTLTADINLMGAEWTPIGTAANPFSGIFDGNGHIISNLQVASDPNASKIGLFGLVKGNADGKHARIQNLTIENAEVFGYSYVAAICGNGFIADFDNCHVKGNIDVQISGTENYVGSIVGHLYGDVTNCSAIDNDAEGYPGIIKGCYAGGIVGWIGESGYTVSGCTVNNINIYGEAGGIIGLVHQGAVIESNSVEDCTITGASGLQYCGLIAGDNRGSASSPSFIINNEIPGTVGTYNNAPLTQSAPLTANTVVGTGVVRDTEGKITAGTFESAPAASALAEGFNVTSNPDGSFGVKGVRVATIGDTQYTVAEALAAAKAMTGNVVITLTDDVDLSAFASVDMSGSQFAALTIDGAGKTITKLAAPLITNMGLNPLTVKNLTFKDSAVAGNVSGGLTGAGVITSGTAAAQDITIDTVVVDGGTITSEDYAGAFVGYFQGHSTGDLIIRNSEVKNLTITSPTGGGSVGSLVGHIDNGTFTVANTKIGNNTLVSQEEGSYNEHKTGVIAGTNLGASATVDATVVADCKINDSLTIEKLIGRMNESAVLTFAGGEYLYNPTIIGSDKNSLSDIVPVTAGNPVNINFADKMGLLTENGKYVVKDVVTRSLEVAADLDEAYVDDTVTAIVKLNGNGMTYADWTFVYDPAVFECADDTDHDGSISANEYVTDTPFTNGTTLATYTLKVKAQATDNVDTALSVADSSVVGNDRETINQITGITDKVADAVTIKFRTFTATEVKFDGTPTTDTVLSVPYDAQPHTLVVTSEVAGAEITYTVNGGEETETAPALTEMGDYTVIYKVAKPGYTTVEETLTITVADPLYDIEIVKDFVTGKVAVIVYTNLNDVCYTYDGKLMVDITAKGYDYENDSTYTYTRAFAYVTEPLKDSNGVNTLDKEIYKTKLDVLCPVSSLLDIINIDYDLNCNGTVGTEDINAAYGVYNKRPLYYEDINGMKIVLKADVNCNKEVDATDAEAVYNQHYGINN